jgi:D-alanine-D-alanine ligase-like ATP-grasp enzyme
MALAFGGRKGGPARSWESLALGSLRTFFFFWTRLRLRRQYSAGLNVKSRTRRYVEMWREAAAAVGAEFSTLPGDFCEMRLGENRVRVWQQRVPLDNPVVQRLAGDKPVVSRLLSAEGLPVPDFREFCLGEIGSAVDFLRGGNRPCVVKPAEGTGGGTGVTTNVRTVWELFRAAAYASVYSTRLLIEEQIAGCSYRLLYLDGELLDAVRRRAPTVVGDGRSTVVELMEAENQRRAAQGGEAVIDLLAIDPDCRATLRRAGLSPRSVPEAGREVVVKTVSNSNHETENESVRHLLAPALVGQGARAARILGVRLAGVDVITENPALSLEEGKGAINEVNTCPALHFHYQVANRARRVPVAIPILRFLLGGVASGREADEKERMLALGQT